MDGNKGLTVVREALAHAFSDAPVASPQRERVALLLQIVNLSFAAVMVSAWTYISYIIADPIAWATWVPLSRHANPGLFDYPFSLLWGLPVGGVVAGFCARRLTMPKLMITALWMPLLVLGMIFGWFYLTPIEWH